MTAAHPYVGRFAPSPTGPLHFGSLLAAVASYLEARCNRGRWLVRIEDIDPPRSQKGASAEIVAALERYGFEWDGDIYFQSRSAQQHEAALRGLLEAKHAYRCGCSRRDLAGLSSGPLGVIYPGTCREGTAAKDTAVRVRTRNTAISFVDKLQGSYCQRLESQSGDFVISRRDGLIAYHLAVVVDDHFQGITDIVRGIDLLDSTPRQIWLQQLLQYETPAYCHIPVAVNLDGSKLSKLTGAKALPGADVERTLFAALAALGQNPPPALARASIAEIWSWGSANWDILALRGLGAVYPLKSGIWND